MNRVVHPEPDPDFLPIPDPGSRGQKVPDLGSRIRKTGFPYAIINLGRCKCLDELPVLSYIQGCQISFFYNLFKGKVPTVLRIRITIRIRIPLFPTLTRIRIRLFTTMRSDPYPILLFFKVMRITDHWSTIPPRLHFEPIRLNLERPSPYMAPF
jgi:hypothetical protein